MARLGLDASGNLLVNVAAGGAGGGAVTIADGDDVVEGALADAAVTTDIAGTVNAKLRGLVVIASAINTKLPSQGQAIAAASVPVVLPAAQISTLTPPAAITGFALETGGNLAGLNTKMPAQGQALAAASVPVVLTAAQIITLTPPTSVTAAPSAATAGGATPYSYVAAAALNQDSTVVKNAAGQLYAIAALSTIAALRFLKVYDKASAPTSADTPVLRLPIPANASTGAGLVLPISVGVVFAG